MSEISDLIFKSNEKLYRHTIEEYCKVYKNENYNIEKIYEENQLVGVFIYIDIKGIRYLEEANYIGKDPFMWLKQWRRKFRKDMVHKLRVNKYNVRMIKFYTNMKFRVIGEDEYNFYLEYRR